MGLHVGGNGNSRAEGDHVKLTGELKVRSTPKDHPEAPSEFSPVKGGNANAIIEYFGPGTDILPRPAKDDREHGRGTRRDGELGFSL